MFCVYFLFGVHQEKAFYVHDKAQSGSAFFFELPAPRSPAVTVARAAALQWASSQGHRNSISRLCCCTLPIHSQAGFPPGKGRSVRSPRTQSELSGGMCRLSFPNSRRRFACFVLADDVDVTLDSTLNREASREEEMWSSTLHATATETPAL